MTVHLGPWTFDHASYDAESDVAYLSIGKPQRAVGEETPEGHVALYAEDTGEFCGLTIIGIRAIIEAEGQCVITVPTPDQEVPVDTADLRDLVRA